MYPPFRVGLTLCSKQALKNQQAIEHVKVTGAVKKNDFLFL
jgi:hypothetical protein